MFQQDRIELALDVPEFIGVNHDLFCGSLHTSERLVDHDPRVGEGPSFAGGARRQQDCPHRSCLADAVCRHIAGDKLHGVIDCQTRRHAPTR
jgi:hypothetical protein